MFLRVLAVVVATQLVAASSFIDRKVDLPTQHIYTGGWEHFVGGGVAVLDCNNDDLPDLVAAGGTSRPTLFINRTSTSAGAIEMIEGQLPQISATVGFYPIDFDSDGQMDLVALRVGPNMILKGDGACGFTDVSPEYQFSGEDRWSTAFSAIWEDGNWLPTLAIGNYVDRFDPNGPFEACDVNELHRPSTERYSEPLLLDPGFCPLSMLISDWQRTGSPELRISNDRHYYVRGGYEEMWQLSPLRQRGAEDGWEKVSLWGMGIASGDIDGNGFPDVMLTSMGDQLLQLNDGERLAHAPFEIGTYAQRPHVGDDGRPSTGWHSEFGDINNDGRLDLFIAKGNVDQMPSSAMADPNNLLLQLPNGTFKEVSVEAGVATTDRSRGGALADLNGDGRLDLIVVNRRAPLEIWENSSPAGNWLKIALHQPAPNRFAVGAWVEVVTDELSLLRELTIGGGHAGGQAIPLHFGIGAAEKASVRVQWPGGIVSDWVNLEANTLHRIKRSDY